MGVRQPTAFEAVRDGLEFTRSAWRSAGLIQLFAATGIALLFIGVRAPLEPGTADRLSRLGLAISLLAWAPLWGTLHRLALGGAAARRVRIGGLQFDMTALRLLVLGWGAWAAMLFSLLPLVAISALVFILFHGFGMVRLGPFGDIQISFLIAALVWLAGMAALGYLAARMAFAPAASVSRRRLTIAEAWPLTEGRVTFIARTWALAQAPALLCLALLLLTDSLELLDEAARASRWPMSDAILGGAVLGFIAAFVHAPLTAGVLGLLYRRHRAERAAAAAPAPPSPLDRWASLSHRSSFILRGAIARAEQRLDQRA
ncbi:MAG TPA: hypothetical protein VL358_14220 [Caulobacteraceae bacterium]|jgi:hypothetical protein|nr:hypothetical protein [Caulobacteraceae bacterium]